jgi:uncharacterized membrane protein YgcG
MQRPFLPSLATVLFTSALLFATFCAPSPAQDATTDASPNAPASPPSPAFKWPRTYQDGTTTLMVYQPEIEKWDGFNFQARFAVSIQQQGQAAPTFGVIWVTANSNVDKDEGVVTLTNIAISKTNFPTDPDGAKKYAAFLTTKIPAQSLPIPLDQIDNKFLLGQALKKVAAQPVKNTPPKIIFSNEPALLVLINGDPVLRPVAGTNCNRVFNTNALIVQNATDGGPYYLRAVGYWYKSDSIAGPWSVDPNAANPPSLLPSVYDAAMATGQINPMDPPAGQNPPPPDIYVSTVPAELVQTDGEPSFVPIHNTSLLEVKNSDNAIILDISNQLFYVLISGRWFSSPALTGQPWSYVPASEIPSDFANIPPNSDKGNVLISVPGTPQAEEAVIANSIPQTATVNRQAAQLSVGYDGAPQFAPVSGTSLQYAVNTLTPVIEVNPSSFYAVSNGVWFTAPVATGPWAVATAVPPVIYTIPVSSPMHYVTYVQVYGYTDSVVYVGYTPGYYGTVVTPSGLVVYGSGYTYPPYIGTTVYVAPPPTYGYGAGFAEGAATGFLFGFAAGAIVGACCEPHWGCWGGGGNTFNTTINNGNVYNNWSNHVVNSPPAYGYHGGAYHAAGAYNPYNGSWAAAANGAHYNSATGTFSADRAAGGYNANTGNYAAGQQRAGYNSETGTAAAGERGVSGNTQTGNWNAGREGGVDNAETGRSASGQTTASGNAYNGNWDANQSRSYNDSKTGASASSSTTASGNADNGTASSQTDRSATSANGSSVSSTVDKTTGEPTTRSGTTYNANTGQTKSYDHTEGQDSSPSHVYSDSDGNVYRPSSDGNGYQKATSNGWQNAGHSQSDDLDRQSQGWGDRSSGGGGRWGGGGGGGDRWGGGGGGRFGGGGGGGRWR